MQPTRLTLCLFAAGFVPLLVGVFFALLSFDVGWIHILVLGFDLGLIAVFCLDGFIGWRQRGLRVTREKPVRLSVGIDNEVTLLVENRGKRKFDLMLRDEVPLGF